MNLSQPPTTVAYGRVKAISLDVWNTLIEGNPEYKHLRKKYFSDRYGLDAEFVEKQWKLIGDGQDHCQMLTNQPFQQKQLVYLAMLAMGIDHKTVNKDLPMVISALKNGFLTYPPLLKEPDLPTRLLFLQGMGYELVISCNTGMASGNDVTKVLRHHGLFPLRPDKAVFSDSARVAKPHKEFWQLVYDKVNQFRTLKGHIYPEEILHLGDNVLADCYPAVNWEGLQTKAVHRGCPDKTTVMQALEPLLACDTVRPQSTYDNVDNMLEIYYSYLFGLAKSHPVPSPAPNYELKQVET